MGLRQDCGIVIGRMRKGPRNLITDVSGVLVGQVTLKEGPAKTGVTAILPHSGDLFHDKVAAGACVINGYGKSMGLIQIDELGTLETPIVMTNTLSIGTAATALVKEMMRENPDIGGRAGTVNCVVTECNDGRLNDIRGLHVTEEHVIQALNSASEDFEEGAVGSGTGMSCMDLKGGIGSASRILELDGREFAVGAIVMANFGKAGDLMVDGRPVGQEILEQWELDESRQEKGSIIMVIATDLPLSDRQLRRAAKRSVIGIGRTGSYLGNGSGDLAIAFSTANRVPHYSQQAILETKMVHDDQLDTVFRAVVEAVEESVISALYHAETTVGRKGTVRRGLREYLEGEIK